jgi:transcriptional regulator with XRE-family HTH domain
VKQEFAARLRRLRRVSGRSQEVTAHLLGLSGQAALSWMEQGRSLPSFTTLIAMSDLFKISLDELMRGSRNSTLRS